MTALPPGHTVQDLTRPPAGYNPNAQAMTDLTGDQVSRSLQQQGQKVRQDAMTASAQQASQLVMAHKAMIARTGGAPASRAIAEAVMGADNPIAVAADWIGLRR